MSDNMLADIKELLEDQLGSVFAGAPGQAMSPNDNPQVSTVYPAKAAVSPEMDLGGEEINFGGMNISVDKGRSF